MTAADDAQEQPVPTQRSAADDARLSDDPHYGRHWLILAVILVAQVMILVDATVVNVALPSAQRDLGFSDATRQWVITAYVLAFGSLLPLGGRLADVVGRKRMFLAGLLGFAAASAVAGAAPNIATLISARAVQGAFAAVLAPAALCMIAVTFTDLRELNKAFGLFGAVSGSAGALGLLLGGLLTDYVNWRWCMYVNIVFAAAGIVGGLTLMHHLVDADKPRLSLASTVIGSTALFGIVFGGAKAQTDGWGSAVTVTSLAAGVALLIGFVFLQKYDRHPLIPLRVLADRNRGAAYLRTWAANFALFAVFLFLTYYFQGVLGYSPIKTGLAFLPLPLAIGIAATVTQSKLIQHFTMRGIVVSGLVLAGAGSALMTRADIDTHYAAYVLPGLVMIGAGIGSAVVVCISIGQQGVAPRDAGTAGAMNNVSQQLGSAIGVALISTFVATATSHYLRGHQAGHVTTVVPRQTFWQSGFGVVAGDAREVIGGKAPGVLHRDEDPDRVVGALGRDDDRAGRSQGAGLGAVDQPVEGGVPRGGQNRVGGRPVRAVEP